MRSSTSDLVKSRVKSEKIFDLPLLHPSKTSIPSVITFLFLLSFSISISLRWHFSRREIGPREAARGPHEVAQTIEKFRAMKFP